MVCVCICCVCVCCIVQRPRGSSCRVLRLHAYQAAQSGCLGECEWILAFSTPRAAKSSTAPPRHLGAWVGWPSGHGPVDRPPTVTLETCVRLLHGKVGLFRKGLAPKHAPKLCRVASLGRWASLPVHLLDWHAGHM